MHCRVTRFSCITSFHESTVYKLRRAAPLADTGLLYCARHAWRGGVVVRTSDLQPWGYCRFESRPLRFTWRLWASCSHTMCLCSPSSRSGIALAMRHRLSGISTYTGSTAWEREMSTSPTLHSEYYVIFTFILPPVGDWGIVSTSSVSPPVCVDVCVRVFATQKILNN